MLTNKENIWKISQSYQQNEGLSLLCDELLTDSLSLNLLHIDIDTNIFYKILGLLKKDIVGELYIDYNNNSMIEDMVNIMKMNKNLKVLQLSNYKYGLAYYNISNKGCKHIGDLLSSSSSIHTLILQPKTIKGYTYIWKAVKNKINIRVLYMHALTYKSNKVKYYKYLISTLIHNKSIIEMCFINYFYWITSIQYCKLLCSAIKKHNIFTVLDFSYNGLSSDILKRLCCSLKYNKCLQNLYLNNNSLQFSDCKYINNLLNYVKIQELYLQHNLIGNKGIQLIINKLSKNSSLKKLNLLYNLEDNNAYVTPFINFNSIKYNNTLNTLFINPLYYYQLLPSLKYNISIYELHNIFTITSDSHVSTHLWLICQRNLQNLKQRGVSLVNIL